MELDNSFEVPLPPAEAWKVLLDIERIAPCMPGAELTEVVDKTTYKGRIAVRLGPVALTFAGTVKFDEVGGANATAEFSLQPAGGGSKVLVHTNLTLSGSVAQYGRGVGIIQATAAQIMNQFAKCLKDKIGQQQVAAPPLAPNGGAPAKPAAPAQPAPTPAAKPISGFALIGQVIWNAIAGLFRRS